MEGMESGRFAERVRATREQLEQPSEAAAEQFTEYSKELGGSDIFNPSDLTAWMIRKRLESRGINKANEADARISRLQDNFRDAATYLEKYGSEVPQDGSPSHTEVIQLLKIFDGSSNKSQPLTPEREAEIDRFLLGDTAYEKRLTRLTNKYDGHIPSDILDAERRRIAINFFAAMGRKGYRAENSEQPWSDAVGPFQRIQEKAAESLAFSAHTPVRELARYLADEAGENFIERSAFGNDSKSLAQLCDLDTLKKKLSDARQVSPEEHASIVISVVNELSKSLRRHFPYGADSRNIPGIKATQEANCAGYALMGSLLLNDLGIGSIEIAGTGHAFLGFVTPDDKFRITHMQGDPSIELASENLANITSEELIAFAKDPARSSLAVVLRRDAPVKWWGKQQAEEDKFVAMQPETIYLSKDLPAAMRRWLRDKQSFESTAVQPDMLIPHPDSIDPSLIGETPEQLKKIIERDPDNPQLYNTLADKLEQYEYRDPRTIERTFKIQRQWNSLVNNVPNNSQARETNFLKRVLKIFTGDH